MAHARRGFSLIEALLSIVIMSLMAAVLSGVYMVGLQTIDADVNRTLLDGQLRSRMEELLSRDFAALSDGSQAVTVNGKTYTVTWVVNNADLDNDAVAEPDAVAIAVTIDGRTIHALRTDSTGLVGKI